MPQFLPYQNASFVSTELRTLVKNGEAKRIWVLSLDVRMWIDNQDILNQSDAAALLKAKEERPSYQAVSDAKKRPVA